MKMHTTNYNNTFISIAEDCPATTGTVPQQKDGTKTIVNLQFDMVKDKPYLYDSDDVVFGVYAEKNDISLSERAAEREKFFSKGQPCLRSSALTKRYGWGIHSNAEGKVAMFAVGSKEYEELANDETIKKVKAMRSKKAG